MREGTIIISGLTMVMRTTTTGGTEVGHLVADGNGVVRFSPGAPYDPPVPDHTPTAERGPGAIQMGGEGDDA